MRAREKSTTTSVVEKDAEETERDFKAELNLFLDESDEVRIILDFIAQSVQGRTLDGIIGYTHKILQSGNTIYSAQFIAGKLETRGWLVLEKPDADRGACVYDITDEGRVRAGLAVEPPAQAEPESRTLSPSDEQRTALEADGWAFFVDEEVTEERGADAWRGEHPDHGRTECVATVEGAVIAAGVMMEGEDGTDDPMWFEQVEVPFDPQGRNVGDLTDIELEQGRKRMLAENPEVAEAMRLEMERRDLAWNSTDGEVAPAPSEPAAEIIEALAETTPVELEEPASQQAEDRRLREDMEAKGWYFEEDTDGTWYGENRENGLKTMRHASETMKAAVDAAEGLQWGLENGIVQRKKEPETEPAQMSLFNYDELEEDTRNVVLEATKEIKDQLRIAYQSTVIIGEKLGVVKGLLKDLKYGQWGKWLKAETNFSRDTADKMIDLAKAAKVHKHLANEAVVPVTSGYLLVAAKVPESARIEADARAGAGEKITTAKAREITNRHTPPGPEKVHPAGTCRECGCTEKNACVAIDDGEVCSWTDEKRNYCTHCRDKKQSRRNVLKGEAPAVVKEQEILPSGDLADQLQESDESIPKTIPSESDTPDSATGELSEPIDETVESRKSPEFNEETKRREAWEASAIEIIIRLNKVDGHPDGRMVQIGVRAGEFAPQLSFPHECEVLPFSRGNGPTEWFTQMPCAIAAPMMKLYEDLPTMLAQEEVRKAAEAEKAKATAKPAAPKPASKKPAAKKPAAKASVKPPAKKPAAKKAASKKAPPPKSS